MNHIPYHDMYSGPGESMGEPAKLGSIKRLMDKCLEDHERYMAEQRRDLEKFMSGLSWDRSTQYYDEHGRISMIRGQHNPINFNIVLEEY